MSPTEAADVRHRLLAPRTRPGDVFDFAFGLMLPLVCFALDPGVLYGNLSFGLVNGFPLGIYVTAALAMIAVLAWLVFGGRWRQLDAVLAGMLFTGGTMAFVIGCALFPLATIGLFVLIGVLGFVPFVTAFVCFRASARALNGNAWRPAPLVAMLVALGTLGVACAYQATADSLIERTVAEALASPDPDAARDALRRMDGWRPFVPRREVGRRGRQLLLESEDLPHAQELRLAFDRMGPTSLLLGGGAD